MEPPADADAPEPTTDRAEPESPTLTRPYVLASLATLALTVVATAVGLFVPGFYRDADVLLPQLLGQDLLTLGVAVPALAVSLWFARRGSLRGYVAWLGVTGYLLYTYATYAFMTAFNELYLVYVALLALTLYSFVGGLLRVDPERVSAAVGDQSVRPYVAFFGLSVALVGLAWLADVLGATLGGTVPEVLVGTGLPAPVIQSLDLGVILPGMVLTAYWLWVGRPWASLVTGVLLVKVATLGMAVLAMGLFQTLDGAPVPAGLLVVFGGLTVLALALTGRYFLALGDGPTPGAPADRRTAPDRRSGSR